MADEDIEELQDLPIGEVLPSFDIASLPAGWTPIEAFVLIKCLDENGNPTRIARSTNQLNREELLGALQVQVGLLDRELLDEWESG